MALIETLDLNLTPDRAQKIVGTVSDAWKTALDARQGMDQRIAGYWLRYEAAPPKRTLPFAQASNLRIPLTMWVVDGIWVRLMRTIYGQKPSLALYDENPEQPPDAAPLERMLGHLTEVDLNLRHQESHVLLNALVEGTGIGKLMRRSVTRSVRDVVGERLLENDILERDGLGYDAIDLKDFAVANPAQPDVHKQPWVGHRVWLRWDDIVRRQKGGIYRITQDQLSVLKTKGKQRRGSEQRVLEQTKADLDRSEDMGYAGMEEWECVEFNWRYDADGDGLEEETLLTVALDYPDTPLRGQYAPAWNGRRPYFIYRPIPRANRFYGRSPAGVQQPLQDEADAEVNQSLDASTFTILSNLTPIVNRAFKREWEQHKWVLGKPLYVDTDPGTFRTVGDSVRYPIQLSTTQMAQLLAMAERASGISDPQLGKPAEGTKTAYEVATVTSEGNVRFAEMVEQIQLTRQELGYQIIEYAYQMNLESPEFKARLMALLGVDPFANVRMQDIRKRLAVKPTGNTITANKDLSAKKSMAVFQIFRDDPFVQMDLKRAYFLRRRVLQDIGWEAEAEQVIGTADEVEKAKELIQNAADTVTTQPQFGKTAPLGTTAVPGTIIPPGALPQDLGTGAG